MSIVLISYTPITAGGGVPRWNRDVRVAFPDAVHYSWWDYPDHDQCQQLDEWEKARILNYWLVMTKRITMNDVVIVDGFWGTGLEAFPNVVSVAHGIWSHLTYDDVAKGKMSEFPVHHAVQVKYRKRHLERGGRIVAVSDFIAEQMMMQWGFKSVVINNGIDTCEFMPCAKRVDRKRPVVIHGVTTSNKGFAYVEEMRKHPVDVLLLDDAADFFGLPKYEALAQADVFMHPSAYEGNSYMCLEAMSCDVPIVAHDVGLLWFATRAGFDVGNIISRDGLYYGDHKVFADFVMSTIKPMYNRSIHPRRFAERFSIERFYDEWRAYVKKEFGIPT